MAHRRSTPAVPFEPKRPIVVVCRGGDCGSRRKHRATDHAAQLTRISKRIDSATASVAVSKCLDACEFSNVIVVVPGAAGRTAGIEPTWVGGVLDDAATDDIIEWVNDSDNDPEPPALVQIQQFRPTRQSRRELTEPGTLPGHRT